MTEILTTRDLLAEGRALRHCAYTYSWAIKRGRCSVWSYKVDGQRRLTLEVSHGRKQVVQVRGNKNRLPKPSELLLLQRWMRDNELELMAGLPVA